MNSGDSCFANDPKKNLEVISFFFCFFYELSEIVTGKRKLEFYQKAHKGLLHHKKEKYLDLGEIMSLQISRWRSSLII